MSFHRRSGFSIIELMLVVAIIGVLAAIAIPNFLRYQLRARASEAATHLQSIARSQGAYYGEYGTYVSVPTPVPASLPGVGKLAWPSGTAFAVIGFEPEGAVQFQYLVSADTGGGSGPLVRFTAEARGDLDGDAASSYFAYVRPGPGVGGMPGALPGTTCVGTGVYGPGGQNVLDSPGPCDAASGRDRF